MTIADHPIADGAQRCAGDGCNGEVKQIKHTTTHDNAYIIYCTYDIATNLHLKIILETRYT